VGVVELKLMAPWEVVKKQPIWWHFGCFNVNT
jgi:hypothetical protein